MAITTLIKINGQTPPKIKGYRVSREKLYSEAERSVTGTLSSRLIGIFPVITLAFAPTTQAQMSTIINLLDGQKFTVNWWDEKTDSLKIGEFYAGKWEIPLLSQQRGLYEEFSVNLIALKKL